MSNPECSSNPTNLVERGIGRRRGLGVASLVAGAILAAALVATHAARGWRALLFVPFVMSANGFLQAREKTCVVLAALGRRETDDGRSYAAIGVEEGTVLRRRAMSIGARAVVIAAAITALVYMV